MENKEINLEKIKEASILLLNAVDVEPHETIPFVTQHPFTSTTVVYMPKDGKPEMLDITIEENKKTWLKHMEKMIKKSEKMIEIYMMINKPYRMLWLKLIKDFISKKVFSEYLKDAWVSMDNPNQDANIKLNEIAKFFQYANKKALMDEEEYKIWEKIPQKITLWRGVATGREKKGFSWTDNRETAEWFANRWHRGGIIYEIKANKADVFAYFSGEKEYVINPSKYTMKIVAEYEPQNDMNEDFRRKIFESMEVNTKQND